MTSSKEFRHRAAVYLGLEPPPVSPQPQTRRAKTLAVITAVLVAVAVAIVLALVLGRPVAAIVLASAGILLSVCAIVISLRRR